MERGIYNLYIDESGSFAGPRQPSVVCGVLEDTSATVDWRNVRMELARALPFMEYPFHARLLNLPAAWLAASMRPSVARRDKATPREQAILRQCAAARDAIVAAAHHPVVADFLGAVERDRLPNSTTLHVAGAWLRRTHPQSYRSLEALASQLRLQLTDTFRHVFRRYRASQLIGIAAMADTGERDQMDAFGAESDGAARRDGYVRALETLLERALCLLRPKSTRIDLWVATRYVQTRGFGQLDLSRPAIEEIVKRAQAFPHLETAPKAAGVRAPAESDVSMTTARGIVRFDESAPVGIVIADFLSNRLFHMLRGNAAADLESVCEEAQARTSLPLVCAPADPRAERTLPALCADGHARQLVLDAYRGHAGSSRKLAPRWNREQAESWIEFAHHTRRGPRNGQLG